MGGGETRRASGTREMEAMQSSQKKKEKTYVSRAHDSTAICGAPAPAARQETGGGLMRTVGLNEAELFAAMVHSGG